MPTDDAFRDLRDSPQLFAFVQSYLPALQKEAAHLRAIGAKRIAEGDLGGDQYKYDVFVRHNRYLGQINDDIVPEAIAFFEDIKGRTFELGVMNGNGFMYLGLGPDSFLGVHQDYPDENHQYNRVVLPLDMAEPSACSFLIVHEGKDVVRTFAEHPFGYSFNPAARHGAANDSRSMRTVLTFQFTRV